MMKPKKNIFISFALLICLQAVSFAQGDSLKPMLIDSLKSAYSGLDTLKFCNVNLFFQAGGNRPSVYEVNDKKVSEEVYDKYDSMTKNLELCTPCFLETYDQNNVLLYAAVQYQDCRVGIYGEFYPNGKIKVVGQYKENDSGNWDDIYDRGYCGVKEGTWTYSDISGHIIKTENYKDGVLIQ